MPTAASESASVPLPSQSAVIDDFAIAPIGARERSDLLEILDDRVGSRSTLITSQLPVDDWHAYIGDPTPSLITFESESPVSFNRNPDHLQRNTHYKPKSLS